MYIPGFGDVSAPALQATLARSPGTQATAQARSGVLGALAPSGAPGFNTPLNQLVRERRVRDGSTGQQVDDGGDGGDTSIRQVRPYPTVLPPLSPEMLAAIESRRALANRQLAEAEARADSLRSQAQLANVGRILGIEEETGRERREGMAELAAKGLARSPMFANPLRREVARQQQERIGESQQTLANTLDQLQATLEAARLRREEQLSQIAFEETQARSNVPRLMGLA